MQDEVALSRRAATEIRGVTPGTLLKNLMQNLTLGLERV